MTLRDQLDQIARLDKKATQGDGDLLAALNPHNRKLFTALVNFWRSGGRELAEDGMRYRWLRDCDDLDRPIAIFFNQSMYGSEVNTPEATDAAIDAARAKEGKS